MVDRMDFIGLANIFEKKEHIIDGKKLIYYKLVDGAVGFFYDFGSGKDFVVLYGKLAGEEINLDSDLYEIVNYKNFNQLCEDNNYTYDFDKFIDKYQKNIGHYYKYINEEKTFYEISDKELLKKIKRSNKDFDDTILNNDTDISQMYSTIKKTIISQDEQIMKILTSLFKNQKVINSKLSLDMITKLKENIIIYGSTGTGKTEILKRIAKIYNVPIVIEDATSLSETGYHGRSVTDMLEDLYLAADKNIELAEKGILVIDEFDKLAEKGNDSDHVSRSGVQRSLLKLLDGSTLYFGDNKFDTSKLSVVALGAFIGITEDDDYSKITTVDFVKYGIMRELMGRFSKLVAMNPLSKEDIKEILIKSDFSPLNTYKLLFESMNISFSYDESFVDYIAEKALELNSGARSLKTIFDDVISSAMFRIFAGEYSAINLTKPTSDEKPYILTKKMN